MNFGKRFVCVMTAVLLALLIFAYGKEDEAEDFLSLDITIGECTETVFCHDADGSGDYYFFLPACADLSHIRMRTNETDTYFLDNLTVEDGMICDRLVLNHAYELWEKEEMLGTLTILRSENVGTMFVDVASGSMEYIHEQKGNQEKGKLRLYTQDGRMDHSGNISEINGRGNSTWSEPKKSYSVKLPVDADLLGMGKAQKWILTGNSMDISNLRNKVVYDFAKEFGLSYAPDCDWVDLYLNGEYAGLYLLCERNEVHPERVNISDNGSFLVARDAQWRMEEQGRPFVITEKEEAIRIYYADMEQEALLRMIQSMENAVLAEDGIDPVTGKNWTELLDRESWVRRFLVDEVFGNVDGTALSRFFYFDGGDPSGKIYAGPVWDYDLSMYLDPDHPEDSAQIFFANVPNCHGAEWPDALYRKQEFYGLAVKLYEQELLPLLNSYVETIIPQYARRIHGATQMNGIRWGYREPESSPEELFRFLELRIPFLSSVWLEGTEYCYLNTHDVNWENRYYAVEKGSLPPDILKRVSDDSNYVYRWYNIDTGEPFDLNTPVYEDANLQLRYKPVQKEEAPEKVSTEKNEEEKTAAEEAAKEKTGKEAAAAEKTGKEEAKLQEMQPEETRAKEVPAEENIPDREPIPLTRLAPAMLFTVMLLGISLVSVWQTVTCTKQKKDG